MCLPTMLGLFFGVSVSNMKLQSNVNNVAQTRGVFVVLFINGLLLQLAEWLNELIRLRCIAKAPVAISDIYRYVSVLLFSLSLPQDCLLGDALAKG